MTAVTPRLPAMVPNTMNCRQGPYFLIVIGLLAAGCGDTSPDAAAAIADVILNGVDPAGDQECEDAAAMPTAALDLARASGSMRGNKVELEIVFHEDFAAYLGAGPQDQPGFTLQYAVGGINVVESFFSERNKMKVSDEKASVSFTALGDTLSLTMTDFEIDLADVDGVRVTTIADDFGNYSGRCTDMMPLELIPN